MPVLAFVPTGYGLHTDGSFVNPDGKLVNAVTAETGNTLSRIIFNGTTNKFKISLSHELIHYHHFKTLGGQFDLAQSEFIAHKYSGDAWFFKAGDTGFSGGHYKAAFDYLHNAGLTPNQVNQQYFFDYNKTPWLYW